VQKSDWYLKKNNGLDTELIDSVVAASDGVTYTVSFKGESSNSANGPGSTTLNLYVNNLSTQYKTLLADIEFTILSCESTLVDPFTYSLVSNRVDVSSPGDSISTSQGLIDQCPKTLFVTDSASNVVLVTYDGVSFDLAIPDTYNFKFCVT
jgi:hypothetical protein